MSETVWLFLIGQAIAFLTAGVVAHFWQLNLSRENAERISKIEGFIDGLGVDYAKRLHRDDDKYGVDLLLEKYIDRHYELSVPEWIQLYDACVKILSRPDIEAREESGFLFIKQVCIHKAGPFIADRDAFISKAQAPSPSDTGTQ